MDQCNRHGAFSWCELLTSDADAAKRFYAKLFNWTLEPAPASLPGVDYTLVKCADEDMGGTICMPPRDIPQVGRFCVLQDPQGATFNVISYLQANN
ncbi:VOC family protein [Methylomonas montana]|uniref:VOC family protein n=1 Tax=Methylomonas montana TaxID=3058963 RepID=UPI0026589357|nr:VOC family protein [Methylomonas montana]WKJ90607.1 VOC family protein [Methylomonas montana]